MSKEKEQAETSAPAAQAETSAPAAQAETSAPAALATGTQHYLEKTTVGVLADKIYNLEEELKKTTKEKNAAENAKNATQTALEATTQDLIKAKSWSKKQIALLSVVTITAIVSCAVLLNLDDQDKKKIQGNIEQIMSILMKNLQNICNVVYQSLPTREDLQSVPGKALETVKAAYQSLPSMDALQSVPSKAVEAANAAYESLPSMATLQSVPGKAVEAANVAYQSMPSRESLQSVPGKALETAKWLSTIVSERINGGLNSHQK
jgi:hypothetical protein